MLGVSNAMKLYLALSVVFFSTCLGATQHAPLSPLLTSARTLYIDNLSGSASIADRCYDELTKWGRFKIVTDPAHADVIFQIGTHVRTYGLSGNSQTDSAGNTSTSLTEDRVGFTTISVVDSKTNQVLWTDTRRWGNLFNGFHSATREVIKELRKRIEETK